MINKVAYPFFCLLLVLLFTSCFNKRQIISSIEKDIPSSNIKSDELVRIHLRNGKMVDGFLKSIQKDSLILEGYDYQKLLNFRGKKNSSFEESGIILSIPLGKVKSVEKIRAENYSPFRVKWFYPGEKVSVLLYNGMEWEGVIYATKLDGIVLASKNGKLYLTWSDIKKIKIIRKTLTQKIMKIVHITLISLVVLYTVLFVIALSSIDLSGMGY